MSTTGMMRAVARSGLALAMMLASVAIAPDEAEAYRVSQTPKETTSPREPGNGAANEAPAAEAPAAEAPAAEAEAPAVSSEAVEATAPVEVPAAALSATAPQVPSAPPLAVQPPVAAPAPVAVAPPVASPTPAAAARRAAPAPVQETVVPGCAPGMSCTVCVAGCPIVAAGGIVHAEPHTARR